MHNRRNLLLKGVASLGLWMSGGEARAQSAPTTPEAIGIDMPDHFGAWLRGHYTQQVLMFHSWPPMNGGVAFVGDSITEGGLWNSYYPDLIVRNFGIGGDTTLGLERRLGQIVDARPAKIFLLIGTNDLGAEGASAEQITANYARILDRFARDLPQTKIYVQTLLPREARNAAAVRQVNQQLAALARRRGLALIDIYTPFAVADGRLDQAVTQDDLHLTPAGYARWRVILDPLVRAP